MSKKPPFNATPATGLLKRIEIGPLNCGDPLKTGLLSEVPSLVIKVVGPLKFKLNGALGCGFDKVTGNPSVTV